MQKEEQLSAFMDGEMKPDEALLSALSEDAALQKRWEVNHLIRDVLRGDTGPVIYSDTVVRVAGAIDAISQPDAVPLIPESQPAPSRWQKMPFVQKIRPWVAQLTQAGVAACVSLTVIIGVQYYHQQQSDTAAQESPVFNTLPMMGKASPVSLGVPDGVHGGNRNQQRQEQHRRLNALLQDYELQRRLHVEQRQMAPVTSQQPDISSHSSSVMQSP